MDSIPASVGDVVVLSRSLDEFPAGTSATIMEANGDADSYQLRIAGREQDAFVEAARADFSVEIPLPQPIGLGDGIAYTSDTHDLARRYGITEAEYDKLLSDQEGCCAICHRHASALGEPLAVDHDHRNGRVRGLLCTDCNLGLGKFRDRVDLLEEAITYLQRFGAGNA